MSICIHHLKIMLLMTFYTVSWAEIKEKGVDMFDWSHILFLLMTSVKSEAHLKAYVRCKRCGSGRFPGGGNGNLLQCSFLENSMRGAWWATVYGIAKSLTWLSAWVHMHVSLERCVLDPRIRSSRWESLECEKGREIGLLACCLEECSLGSLLWLEGRFKNIFWAQWVHT